VRGQVDILAPLGIDDLVSLTVRPTPAFATRRDAYHERVRQKDWRSRWPELTWRDAD
jgi:uncharacterized protein